MSARVRFAPSPTGHLHIGSARTALYGEFMARALGGTFILRIEDTDQERSKKEFEDSALEDLKWLGIEYEEGPYRQSERLDIYKKYAEQLIKEDFAYRCFCSEEEIEKAKEKATAENTSPHYNRKCLKLSQEEINENLEKGLEYVVRFKVPLKEYRFEDQVRGEVVFPQDMVGDFVLLRSNGVPVYNYCCVIDDWLMKIDHVLRADDHLNNTVRQLMIYEALKANAPKFYHVSLLVGKDHRKLSKRHGDTAVRNYREAGYLPEALVNYLVLLGWSHPKEKDIFDREEIEKVFDLHRFSKSPAIFDTDKFLWLNGQHLRKKNIEEIHGEAKSYIGREHAYHGKSKEWQCKALNLFLDKTDVYTQFEEHLNELFFQGLDTDEEVKEYLNLESTKTMANVIMELWQDEDMSENKFQEISQVLKKDHKIKGKPLFKGMRILFTGKSSGSDLKVMATLVEKNKVWERLETL